MLHVTVSLAKCGCECPTVPPYETPTDRVLCLKFEVDGAGTGSCPSIGIYLATWIQGLYTGKHSGSDGQLFTITFSVSQHAVTITLEISVIGLGCGFAVATYRYIDNTSTLRFPLSSSMLPLTLQKVFAPGWPDEIILEADTCPTASPLNCCEACDPQPCAYELILDCMKGPRGKNGPLGFMEVPYYVNQRIVFRQCDKPGCLYTALGPTESGNPTGGLCRNVFGLDWTGIGCTINAAHVGLCSIAPYLNSTPCRWSDYIVCYPEYLAALGHRCPTADIFKKWIQLDTVNGTITDLGNYLDTTFPTFPNYTLVGTWNCYGCNVFLIDPDQENGWRIPDRIEVRAVTENATGRCTVRQATSNGGEAFYDITGACPAPAGELINLPLLGYDTKEHRCKCCDPGCECVGMWATLQDSFISGSSWQRRSTNACQPPTHSPMGTAVGPGREAEFEFFVSRGTGTGTGSSGPHTDILTVNVVIYCDGTDAPNGWYADFWLNGVFWETKQMIACCCPFGLGVTSSELPDDPGINISIAVGEGCGGITPPKCYEGIEEFYLPVVNCELDIDEILHFVRISPMCWEFEGLISCDRFLRIRICCVAGGLVASWYFPSACPTGGVCLVSGTLDDLGTGSASSDIGLICFAGAISPCPPCPLANLPDQPMQLVCNLTCLYSTVVSPSIGGGNGLPGRDSPSGETWGACITGCGHTLCANWYYTDCQWKVDVYLDDVFCQTRSLDHTCCPLVLGTASVNCPGSDCCIVIGDCGFGFCTYEWDGDTWNLIESTCSDGCKCGPVPTTPGEDIGELAFVNCVPDCIVSPCCGPPASPYNGFMEVISCTCEGSEGFSSVFDISPDGVEYIFTFSGCFLGLSMLCIDDVMYLKLNKYVGDLGTLVCTTSLPISSAVECPAVLYTATITCEDCTLDVTITS